MSEEKHDLSSLHSSSEEEEVVEVPWYDYLVRRPNDDDLRRRSQEQLPTPTELFTSTYPKAGCDGEDITLILRGFRGDSDQVMVSSGLTQWKASDVLCNYLLNDDEIKRERMDKRFGMHDDYRMLELGSGLGKCGLLAHLLLQLNNTILTDGDTNVLKLLRKNAVLTDDDIICQQLKWGKGEATRRVRILRLSNLNI